MSWDNNPYYNPESFGLELVDSIEWDDEAWQFNLTAVWRNERGNYYIAHSSGCSCPSPFEEYDRLSDLDGPHNKAGIKSVLEATLKANADRTYVCKSYAANVKDVSDLLDKLK